MGTNCSFGCLAMEFFFVCNFCEVCGAQGNKICWNCDMISSGVDVFDVLDTLSSRGVHGLEGGKPPAGILNHLQES